ncbi:hypothetical protein ColLi_01604 [Colletotrichum liriopes]|uniref:Cytochrome P450 n=1 Tax=Colletotrichum liriopes TaxID=708192 RepID=A0AA37GD79_9PEZI|nr:hypothetical protein ColLi_01604 [Colletotrichum liriopes]
MERIEERELSWQDTFLGAALSHDDMRGLSCPEELAILSFALIVASADTSRMTTWSFIEAMMQFPEVQARAQAEIGKFTPENGHEAHVRKTATNLSRVQIKSSGTGCLFTKTTPGSHTSGCY